MTDIDETSQTPIGTYAFRIMRIYRIQFHQTINFFQKVCFHGRWAYCNFSHFLTIRIYYSYMENVLYFDVLRPVYKPLGTASDGWQYARYGRFNIYCPDRKTYISTYRKFSGTRLYVINTFVSTYRF